MLREPLLLQTWHGASLLLGVVGLVPRNHVLVANVATENVESAADRQVHLSLAYALDKVEVRLKKL